MPHKDKNKAKEYARIWWLNNKDRCKEARRVKSREYRLNNKKKFTERDRLYNAKYRLANKDKVRQSHRARYLRIKDTLLKANRERNYKFKVNLLIMN